MLKYLVVICLTIFFIVACAPAPSDITESQSESAAESSEGHDEEDGHDDGHDDEDAEEHGSEEGDHSDEHDDEDESEHRGLGAHEHGAAELTIAWSGNEMAIDLQTPAFNVLGFEYTPTTDEEKALLAESVAALEAGDLLQPNAEAECTLVSVDVHAEMTEDAHDDEHDEEGHDEEGHDDHGEEVHSDIDVSYDLDCQQPDNIESLDASALFAQFPNFEDIDVQWVSDTQQSAAELTPANPVVSLN